MEGGLGDFGKGVEIGEVNCKYLIICNGWIDI